MESNGVGRWAAVLMIVATVLGGVAAEPQVPCHFIFGDSLVDNGNNNNIQSLAKANYLPYGIDFPNGPTGRFSNGKTTVDVISKYFVPLYLSRLLNIYIYNKTKQRKY